jgi:hypothetical protein
MELAQGFRKYGLNLPSGRIRRCLHAEPHAGRPGGSVSRPMTACLLVTRVKCVNRYQAEGRARCRTQISSSPTRATSTRDGGSGGGWGRGGRLEIRGQLRTGRRDSRRSSHDAPAAGCRVPQTPHPRSRANSSKRCRSQDHFIHRFPNSRERFGEDSQPGLAFRRRTFT